MKGINYLALEISIERRRLESMAERMGLAHPRVLRQSRKLDKLIVKIQSSLCCDLF